MILTMWNRYDLVLLEEGFQLPVSCQCGGMTPILCICLFSLKNLARKGLIKLIQGPAV